jgi:hypothetical protein
MSSLSRRIPRTSLMALGFLALVCAPELVAQSVRGQLIDRTNGFAIGGAFVVLVGEQGNEVARALTSADGTFLLQAPGAGTYRLQSKRIGYRVSDSPPLQLAAGQTLEYRLEVEEVAAQLPPVVVTGRPRCGSRGEQGTAVAQLWEDTREALAEVRWTQGQGTRRYSLDLYERDVDPDSRHVQRERAWTKTGRSETPFRSLPAESLVVGGYIVGDERAGETYYAPDADVLLSDAFLDTHCFTAREGTGNDSGYVGLAFEPAPHRSLPDIRGVLWVSRRTGELRNLEYQYMHLPRGVPEGLPGGAVDFMRLENGAWIVLRWVIRMPRMGQLVDQSRHSQPIFRVLGYRETGGQVSAIRSSDGTLEYSAAQAILDGTVVDSSMFGRPLSGGPYRGNVRNHVFPPTPRLARRWFVATERHPDARAPHDGGACPAAGVPPRGSAVPRWPARQRAGHRGNSPGRACQGPGRGRDGGSVVGLGTTDRRRPVGRAPESEARD